MTEEKSIPEIKLRQMLQEAADRLHRLEGERPDPTPYKHGLSPDGAPTKNFMNDAYNNFTHGQKIKAVYLETDARFQDFQKNERPEHGDYYKSIYDNWKEKPDDYRTPENEQGKGYKEIDSKSGAAHRRETFAENTKMVEDVRPENKYTRIYNQSLHFTNVDAGAGSDPSKVKEDVEPDDPDI